MARRKNRHAVELGRLGGKGGKGSAERRKAAVKANKVRWQNHAKRLAIHVPESALSSK